MDVKYLNPPQLCPTFGWSHVATVKGGKTIYISGQVSVNERGEVVGRGDIRAQTEQTLLNLAHALAAVGASFKDVVKTNLYVVGLKSAGGWDTHGNNFNCLKENLLPEFDQAYSALLADLADRGLLDHAYAGAGA